MPRDIVILSPIQPDAADLSHVAAKIDATLRASDLANGAITQLLTADGQAVLTVTLNAASHVKTHNETTRLIPGVPEAPVWWIEAWAPAGEIGDLGVEIARAFADRLHAECLIEDEP